MSAKMQPVCEGVVKEVNSLSFDIGGVDYHRLVEDVELKKRLVTKIEESLADEVAVPPRSVHVDITAGEDGGSKKIEAGDIVTSLIAQQRLPTHTTHVSAYIESEDPDALQEQLGSEGVEKMATGLVDTVSKIEGIEKAADADEKISIGHVKILPKRAVKVHRNQAEKKEAKAKHRSTTTGTDVRSDSYGWLVSALILVLSLLAIFGVAFATLKYPKDGGVVGRDSRLSAQADSPTDDAQDM